MIFIIVFTLTSGYFMFVEVLTNFSSQHNSLFDVLSGTLAVLTAALLGFFCGLLVAFLLKLILPKKREALPPVTLVAIRNSNGYKSQFFLNIAQVEGGWEYRFYQKNSDGVLCPESIRVTKSVTIEEADVISGTLSISKVVFRFPISNFIALKNAKNLRHYFRIPRGSVKTDLEEF